jgi:hypothetical protein
MSGGRWQRGGEHQGQSQAVHLLSLHSFSSLRDLASYEAYSLINSSIPPDYLSYSLPLRRQLQLSIKYKHD